MRPDIQKKCRDEIAAILPRQNITWEDLDNLKYVTCVVKETLRCSFAVTVGILHVFVLMSIQVCQQILRA